MEEKELLRTIEYEIEESFENLNFSLQEWRLADELAAQESERYRILSVQHQEGIASTNDLITAETDLTSAELKTKQALIKYYIFLADLKKAVGTINEEI
ncbi:TolC family protein [bacterium]|nr:TolC family protein [bacterium]